MKQKLFTYNRGFGDIRLDDNGITVHSPSMHEALKYLIDLGYKIVQVVSVNDTSYPVIIVEDIFK